MDPVMKPQNEDSYSDDERKVLRKHVTDIDGKVYCVKNLPEEVVAVLFAYVSRSPLSFRRNLLTLLGEGEIVVGDVFDVYGEDTASYAAAKEKAQKFHEKWVVGYGHSSVAEHADLKFAIEDISILGTKILEDNRLARYTEKSTRYVKFDKQHYHKPARIMQNPALAKKYVAACDALFDIYDELYPKAAEFVRKEWPKPADMKDRPYEGSVHAKACDIVRYILPASTYTMVGCSMNARVAEHAMTKLLSHPLEEGRALGESMLREGRKICPTLLKHAAHSSYHASTHDEVAKLAGELLDDVKDVQGSDERPVVIVRGDDDADAVIVAAILYEESALPFSNILEKARKMTLDEQKKVLEAYVVKKGKFEWPQRALEHVKVTTDILMDYGAFRDLQRHRMNTQTNQRVTIAHGYEVPEEIDKAGLRARYDEAMRIAADAYAAISAAYPWEAQYVVPLAYRKRTLFTWNLRNLEHVIRLRSSAQGHISYRRIAQQLYDAVAAKYPLLAFLLTVDKNEYYLGRLKSELAAEEKRAKLAKQAENS